MKIISYNVNGIRAALKKELIEWLKTESPDIFCIQESKAQEEQIDEEAFKEAGYYCHCFSAEKKGYSGVVVFSKTKPDFVKKGIDNTKFDSEGRLIRADFGYLTIINSYFPSGTTGTERQDYKMEYLDEFYAYINNLKKERPNIIACGDYNICHKAIDINHPERHKKTSGFLPEEREWFDKMIGAGFIDSFREFDKTSEKYSWWSYRANSRAKNLGWRLDYHLVSEKLKTRLKNAYILSDAVHSDHCPVVVEIDE
ncbi:MAG: exodeoxyribonuclease III [Bacteroidales bacterium]|jgi:exodeoxyribonuclease-3|nr:exodeoxyribonuclease III [Bacteroidales bacterium]